MSKQKRAYAHRRAQRHVKECEAFQCLICGTVVEKRRTHGHHLIDYVLGGSAHDYCMITLCDLWHKKYHNGELKIDIHRF
jgi:hypothetical protein